MKAEDTRKVKLIFFKESGKYYTEEEIQVDRSLSVYEIIGDLENNYTKYKGMHTVVLFAEDDEIGFPHLIKAEHRKA